MLSRDLPQALAAGATSPKRQLVKLDRTQTMALLTDVGYGRIVFTDRALPAIRPMNHLVDNGGIVIRTHAGGSLARAASVKNVVVAYQADQINPESRLGWSAVITGYARCVTDPAEISRLEAALLPWLEKTNDTVIRIQPEIVSGFRLVEAG